MPTETGASVDTLLVGVDGACPSVLDRLFEAGVAPTLATFFDSAATGPLESQLPPWTPSAWPSIYTGVNPGKHGVFGFLTFDGYDWDVVTGDDVREHAVWELLGQRGLSSVVVNVPVTHPPGEFPGALVPGYVAPEKPTCHPPGLLDDLLSAVPGYRVYPRETDDRTESLASYCDCVRSRGDAAAYLVDRFDPDFGFVQFQAPDTVFHQYPGDWDAVEQVYAAVDDAFERLLDDCDPDTVLIVSDHGIGEYEGYEFRINEYLADHGYVQPTSEGSGMPSWASIARERLQSDDESRSLGTDAARRAVGLAADAGLTADRVYGLLERVGVASTVADRLPADLVRAGTRRVDFANSIAYTRDRIELGVRLNVVGREPNGVVSPDEYGAVRSEVQETLNRARTPDGDRVFEAIKPRELVYSGPYVDAAPDLIVVPAGFDQFLSASLRGDLFAAPTETWNHKPTGVVALGGDGFDQGASIEEATLFDVAPTVCSLLDVPASERMDGRPLGPVSAPEYEWYPEYGRDEGDIDETVAERLADIGYLEDRP